DNKVLILDMKGKKQGEINRDKYFLLNNGFNEGKIAVRDAGDTDAHTVILDNTGKKLFDIKKSKEEFRSAAYWGGYITFSNGEAVGVANDKGDIVIRPKYKTIANLANGYFVARKDEKWGIVNADDETLVDFDYSNFGGTMGDNFIMQDGSSFSLIDKNGKEITSFATVDIHADGYVEYVDVTGLTNAAYNYISQYEQGFTPQQLAKELSLSMDDFHYQSYIGSKLDVDGKMSIELSSRYESYVAEEQTHQEEFNDGWFTQTRTVSDGWNWSTEAPYRITGTITLEDSSINLKDFYKALLEKMTEGRSKVSDNIFTKNIKIDGSTVECRTTLEQNYSTVGIEIVFRR
ncbi:MAG: WG repeat-containing protein, partial [Prevotella sp.]|nr:WG repeat-containing protein [Prevotella sp.]